MDSQFCFRANSETLSEGGPDDFTFNEPVKLSPEEGEISADRCLRDILGDYDDVVRVLTSESSGRDELAGISSSRSRAHKNQSSHPQSHQSQSSKSSTSLNSSTSSHRKERDREKEAEHGKNLSAPNPKKHWGEKYKSSSSTFTDHHVHSTHPNHAPSQRGSSPKKESRNGSYAGSSSGMKPGSGSSSASRSGHTSGGVSGKPTSNHESSHHSSSSSGHANHVPHSAVATHRESASHAAGVFPAYHSSTSTSYNKKHKVHQHNQGSHQKSSNSSSSTISSAPPDRTQVHKTQTPSSSSRGALGSNLVRSSLGASDDAQDQSSTLTCSGALTPRSRSRSTSREGRVNTSNGSEFGLGNECKRIKLEPSPAKDVRPKVADCASDSTEKLGQFGPVVKTNSSASSRIRHPSSAFNERAESPQLSDSSPLHHLSISSSANSQLQSHAVTSDLSESNLRRKVKPSHSPAHQVPGQCQSETPSSADPALQDASRDPKLGVTSSDFSSTSHTHAVWKCGGRRSPLKVHTHDKAKGPPMARVAPMARTKPPSPARSNSHPGGASLMGAQNRGGVGGPGMNGESQSDMERFRSQNLMASNPNILRVEQIFKEIESLKTPEPILPLPLNPSFNSANEPNNNQNEPFGSDPLLLPRVNSPLNSNLTFRVLCKKQWGGGNVCCFQNPSDPLSLLPELPPQRNESSLEPKKEPLKQPQCLVKTEVVELDDEGDIGTNDEPPSSTVYAPPEFSPPNPNPKRDEDDRIDVMTSSQRHSSAKEVAFVSHQQQTLQQNRESFHDARGNRVEETTCGGYEDSCSNSNSSGSFASGGDINVITANNQEHTTCDRSNASSVGSNSNSNASLVANTNSTIAAQPNQTTATTLKCRDVAASGVRSNSQLSKTSANNVQLNVKYEYAPNVSLPHQTNPHTEEKTVQKQSVERQTTTADDSVMEDDDESHDDEDSSSSSESSSSDDESPEQEDLDSDVASKKCSSKSSTDNVANVDKLAIKSNNLHQQSSHSTSCEAGENNAEKLPSQSNTPSSTPSSSTSAAAPSRQSWSLAHFGVRQLSTSPSPVKNQKSASNTGSRSRSAKTSDKASASEKQSSRTSPGAKLDRDNRVDSGGSAKGKDEESRPISPPIKVVATRREHTDAIAAKNKTDKDKIASVHPFSKVSAKKQSAEVNSVPDLATSLTPLISPNKVKGSKSVLTGNPVLANSLKPDLSKASKKEEKSRKSKRRKTDDAVESESVVDHAIGEGGKSADVKSSKAKEGDNQRVSRPLRDFSQLKTTCFESNGPGLKIPKLIFVLNVSKLLPVAANPSGEEAFNQTTDECHGARTNKPKKAASKGGQSPVKKHRHKHSDHGKERLENKKAKKKDHPPRKESRNEEKNVSHRKSATLSSHATSNTASYNSPRNGVAKSTTDMISAPSSVSSTLDHQLMTSASRSDGVLLEGVGSVTPVNNGGNVSVDNGLSVTLSSCSSHLGAQIPMGSPFFSNSQDNETFSNSNFSGSELGPEELTPTSHVTVGGSTFGPGSKGVAPVGGVVAHPHSSSANNNHHMPSSSSSSFSSFSCSSSATSSNHLTASQSTDRSSSLTTGVLATSYGVVSSNSSSTNQHHHLLTPSSHANNINFHSNTSDSSANCVSASSSQSESNGLKSFYSEQAKIFKRKADACSKTLESCLDYAQAVIYYISYAIACLNSNDSPRAYRIFTSKEIKSIINVAMKQNVKYQNAAVYQDRIDIICVLLMKIRGYFEIQAFNVRKEQTVRFVGTLADFIRDRKVNGHGSGSKMLDNPDSPTQSVASYSSNGSSNNAHNPGGGSGSGSCTSGDSSHSSSVQMPADMYSIFENYIDSSQHLIAAHDTWDQAALLLKRPNVAKFYGTVDSECGYTVNIQSAPEPFIQYCNAVINLIRPKMMSANSHQQTNSINSNPPTSQ